MREENKKKQEQTESRRSFMRQVTFGAAAGASVWFGLSHLVSCSREEGDKTSAPAAGEGSMTMRLNHNTGDSVSILGYGCMRLPMKNADDGSGEVIDQEEVNAHVDYALEHGINYFDTAPVYCNGKSEEAMGIALSRHPRESYFIATKLSNFDPSTFPREKSIAMFENSLKYLKTDYVDYLLLHAIGMGGMEAFNQRYVDNGILNWLIEQKEKGRIRNLGFSYHGDPEVFHTMLEMMDRGEIHWDFVQIQLNYIDWQHAGKANDESVNSEILYEELHKRNIPVVIMEPLLGGQLANVSNPIKAKMLQRRPNDSVASWAFRFAGSPEGVLTVLSGMTYMEHLVDNCKTFSPLTPLDEEEKVFLESVAVELLGNKTIDCTNCKYCMPCPYGVNIPGIFMHYNKCINADNVPRNVNDPRYAEARRAFLVGYDRSVPKLRQANRCIDCGNCLSKCPQKIPIPTKLSEINDYVDLLKRNDL